jgi:hypothetical protein
MKTNFLKHILLLVAFTTIFSCSKDDATTTAPQPDPKTFQYRIKQTAVTNANITEYTDFEYNNNNQVTKTFINSIANYQYLYNNAGFLIEFSTINSSFLNSKSVFVLDSNNKVLEQIKFANSQQPYMKIVYSYDAFGNKIEEKNYRFSSISNSYVYENKSELSYNAKNQLITYFTPQYTNVNNNLIMGKIETYEYDERGNKIRVTNGISINNAFPTRYNESLYVYDNIKPAYYPNSILSGNNQTQVTFTEYLQDGLEIKTQKTSTYTHTYNEAGYKTKTLVSPSGVVVNFTLEKIN